MKPAGQGGHMKKLLIPAAFLAATIASGDQLYIVPVFATRVVGASGESTAHVHVLNPGPTVANVTIRDIYAAGGVLDCPLAPDTQALGPLESRDDIRPFCGANLVAAYTISSDRPLVITDDIETTGRGHVEHQSVHVLSDWLPAGRRVVLPTLPIASDGIDRINLFLVNPNPFSITVTSQTPPPGLGLAFDVPSRSTVVRSLPTALIICVAEPCHTFSDLVLQANGIFFAGASWLESDDPVFRDPVLLDE
jgi:hypothetical protein